MSVTLSKIIRYEMVNITLLIFVPINYPKIIPLSRGLLISFKEATRSSLGVHLAV